MAETYSKVRFRINFVMSSDCEQTSLMMSMTVRFSEWMRMTFLAFSCGGRGCVHGGVIGSGCWKWLTGSSCGSYISGGEGLLS